ncbi:hypothetical protein ABIB15_001635 [Marisediminicola sp. UYEF4]
MTGPRAVIIQEWGSDPAGVTAPLAFTIQEWWGGFRRHLLCFAAGGSRMPVFAGLGSRSIRVAVQFCAQSRVAAPATPE